MSSLRWPFPLPRVFMGPEGQPQDTLKWIVVLGTSKIRGLFLSAVDMLLDCKPSDVMSLSKCWGRINTTLGTLRLTFQDFHAPIVLSWPLPTSEADVLECHGNNVASEQAEFAQNSTRFVQHLFQDQTQLPSAIVLDWHRQQDPQTFKTKLSCHQPLF